MYKRPEVMMEGQNKMNINRWVLKCRFHKIFQKIEEGKILYNQLYKISITLMPKPDKSITRKLMNNNPHEYICKILHKMLVNRIQ